MSRSYKSKKFLNKKKRNVKIKMSIFGTLGVVILIGFFYWMQQPSLNIDKIEIIKNTFSKSEKIEARVSEVLDGKFLLLIPKTNALVIPRSEAEEKLKEFFPEIEKINIDLQGFHGIEVEVVEYEPKMIWCNEEDKNYFVSKEGNVFLEEPLLHSYENLLKMEDKKENLELGQNVIDPDFLQGLNSFAEKLGDLDIEILKIKHTDEDVYRMDTNRQFEIVVSEKDDLNSAFENIETILENGALKKEDLDLVDYMDLRFGNKVFYKLRG